MEGVNRNSERGQTGPGGARGRGPGVMRPSTAGPALGGVTREWEQPSMSCNDGHLGGAL